MMKLNAPQGLEEVARRLSELDNLALEGTVSRHFLQLEFSRDHREFRINGNPAGLIYLAKVIVDVASRAVEGSHFHIDETGVADKCDVPVVVRLKAAEWDSERRSG